TLQNAAGIRKYFKNPANNPLILRMNGGYNRGASALPGRGVRYVCGRGGTGRRAALRSLWGNPWRFESSRPHHFFFYGWLWSSDEMVTSTLFLPTGTNSKPICLPSSPGIGALRRMGSLSPIALAA